MKTNINDYVSIRSWTKLLASVVEDAYQEGMEDCREEVNKGKIERIGREKSDLTAVQKGIILYTKNPIIAAKSDEMIRVDPVVVGAVVKQEKEKG